MIRSAMIVGGLLLAGCATLPAGTDPGALGRRKPVHCILLTSMVDGVIRIESPNCPASGVGSVQVQ